ncbi:MAG TPA: HAMP domain-containing sensor histidine kinase, partial [Rhodothermales bacterium]
MAFLTHTVRAAFVATLLLVATGCATGTESRPEAQSGTLDLRGASLDRPIPLSGNWMARQATGDESVATLLAAPDSTWRPAKVPGYFEDQGYPDEGAVWYRLHVLLPPGTGTLKGFLQHADNAHALYAWTSRGTVALLAASGRPATNARQAVLSREPVTFTMAADTSIVFLWKVANFDYLHGGPFHAVYLGIPHGVDRMLLWKVSFVFALFGVFLLVFAAFLVYWWMHKPEVEALAVSLLALVMAVRIPVIAGALEYLFPHAIDFEIRILLEAVTFLMVPALVALLMWGYFPFDMQRVRIGRFALVPPTMLHTPAEVLPANAEPQVPAPRALRTLNTAMVVAAVAFGVVTTTIAILVDPGTTSHVMSTARWVQGVLGLGALLLLGQVLYRRRPLSVAVAIGTLMLVGAGIHDMILAAAGTGAPDGAYLVHYGFLGFILTQTYALIRRYSTEARLARQNVDVLREEVEARTRELRAASIAAHAANLAKSHFLSAVSHELRSPLASILGYTRILHEELGKVLEPQHDEFFDTIRTSGERLTGLVNDILDVAKIEAGMLDLTFTPVELRHLASDVLDQMYPLSRDKGLDLRLEDGAGEAFVIADP